jgi:signal transduction histidine kinase
MATGRCDEAKHTVYNQWNQFEEFPRFMRGVERVEQLDDRRLHWVADFGGSTHEWDAEITDQVPDDRIAWRSLDGRPSSAEQVGDGAGHHVPEERRRIERDLHDGAQQRLLAVTLTFRLAQSRISTDPVGAAELVAQAREEAQLAIQELRELARGIHPALLNDRGLAAALEALATRAPVPVQISGVPSDRLSQRVEACAYFVTADASSSV